MAYNSNLQSYNSRIGELNNKIRATADKDEKSKLATQYTELTREARKLPEPFIKEQNNSLYALVIIDNMLNKKDADINTISNLYDGLDDNLKASPFATKVKIKLEGIKKIKRTIG